MEIWTLLASALGLAIFLEGLPYFVSPTAVRGVMTQLGELSDGTLRILGLGLMVAGLLLAYVSLHRLG